MYTIIKDAKIPKIKRDRRLKSDSPQNLARIKGLIYFQGKSCKRNHNSLRYTKGGQCIECMELAKGKAINPRQRSNINHLNSLKAANEGKTTYIPEKACKHGHLLRFVNSNNCVECDILQREKHKLTQKFLRIKKEYNLSKEEYLNLVKSQNSSCKLCDNFIEDHFKLHIDHCHNTKIVRGLLCNKCNQAIGLFNDNSELMRKAALYCESIK